MKSEYIELKNYMDQSGRSLAVTGAGISYLYGMRRLKESVGRLNAGRIFSASYIKKHPDEFYKMMKDAFLDATFVKGPSATHKALAELENQGKLFGIVTQNMDCLHTIAGSQNVIEFQGSFRDNICLDCGERYFDYKVWNEGKAPRCEKCGAPLMPTGFCRDFQVAQVVSRENMRKAADMIGSADLVLIIGTTGFRSEEYLAKLRKDTRLVQINPSATEFDHMADLNIRADASDVFASILE